MRTAGRAATPTPPCSLHAATYVHALSLCPRAHTAVSLRPDLWLQLVCFTCLLPHARHWAAQVRDQSDPVPCLIAGCVGRLTEGVMKVCAVSLPLFCA